MQAKLYYIRQYQLCRVRAAHIARFRCNVLIYCIVHVFVVIVQVKLRSNTNSITKVKTTFDRRLN